MPISGQFAAIPTHLLHMGLPCRTIHVYLLIDMRADDTGRCQVARRELAAEVDCSLNTLDKCVDSLVAANAITVEQQMNGGGRTASIYVVQNRARLRKNAQPKSRKGGATSAPDTVACPEVEEQEDPAAVQLRADAQAVASFMWDNRHPRPATKFIAVKKLAEEQLHAGWSRDDVQRALMAAPTMSRGAIEVALNSTQRNGRGESRLTKPMARTHEGEVTMTDYT